MKIFIAEFILVMVLFSLGIFTREYMAVSMGLLAMITIKLSESSHTDERR